MAGTLLAASTSALCELGKSAACINGEDVSYPGSTFFIEPASMNGLQLFFVFLVYGYVLFVSADMIGDGAELLLLVPDYADMVGSIVLPILGAIPDGMMVLFSGVGPVEVAQENVAVGVGALAGSTIMLLTLPWIISVYAGQVDMDDNGVCVGYKAKAGQRKTGKTGKSAIQFEDGVSKNAILMFLTSLSYFVIQIPALMVDDQKTKDQYPDEKAYIAAVNKESTSEHAPALYGIIVTTLFFFFYLYLQFLAATNKTPPVKFLTYLLPPQRNAVRLDFVKQYGLLPLIDRYRDNFSATGKMRGAQDGTVAYEAFLPEDAQGPRLPKDLVAALGGLFKEYSKQTPDKKGLHGDDMRNLLQVLGLYYTPDIFKKKFAVADADKSGYLDLNEFKKFFHELITGPDPLPHQQPEPPVDDAGDDDDEEDDELPEEFKDLSPEEQQKQIKMMSVKKMLIGTILVLIFSDPMVDVLAEIGAKTGVPPFYVSFILAPLASNASELCLRRNWRRGRQQAPLLRHCKPWRAPLA
jgi:Ca2+/Na+ antiporter